MRSSLGNCSFNQSDICSGDESSYRFRATNR